MHFKLIPFKKRRHKNVWNLCNSLEELGWEKRLAGSAMDLLPNSAHVFLIDSNWSSNRHFKVVLTPVIKEVQSIHLHLRMVHHLVSQYHNGLKIFIETSLIETQCIFITRYIFDLHLYRSKIWNSGFFLEL